MFPDLADKLEEVEHPPTAMERRVLIASPTQRDGEVASAVLANAGLQSVAYQDMAQLAAEAAAGVGAIVLTDESFITPGFHQLQTMLNSQPGWSEIPIVLLHGGGQFDTAAEDHLRSLRNATLLDRPTTLRALVSAVKAAIRARERQYQLRDQLETIRGLHARFELLANTIQQLAWIAKADGWIFWYNRRWYEYTGTTPEKMEGWGWQSVHDPKMVPRVLDRWKDAIASGKPFEMTFPLKGADGKFRPFLTRSMPLRNDAGEIVLWFGTNTDVTDHHLLLAERDELLQGERLARNEAERAARLKDEFLATLSHELRTPLNAILGWTQILRQRRIDDEDINEGLTVIERNSRVQVQLIEDLLDMSRIISGKLRMDAGLVNLVDVVNAAIESVRPSADARGVRLEKVLDTMSGPVRGDAGRLQQVVWNLLSNAIKFTPKGGKIQLALRRMNDHLELSVTDTGIGMKREFLPHAFERFRQADGSTTRSHGGLGLGLAIVKNLVELHGGIVKADSAGEGHGSTFVVDLPLTVVHATDTDATAVSSGESDAARECEHLDPQGLEGVSVLVLDDEEDARNLVSRILRDCKAKVAVAASGADALELLRRERPDVILSDIGMPVEDGYAFIRQVRRLPDGEGGKTPAAALSAFARAEDRLRALRAGFLMHIAKPVEPAELVTVVATLAGHANGRENGTR